MKLFLSILVLATAAAISAVQSNTINTPIELRVAATQN